LTALATQLRHLRLTEHFNAFVMLHIWLTRQKLPSKTSGFGRRFILALKSRGSGASGRSLGIPGERVGETSRSSRSGVVPCCTTLQCTLVTAAEAQVTSRRQCHIIYPRQSAGLKKRSVSKPRYAEPYLIIIKKLITRTYDSGCCRIIYPFLIQWVS
jgi:hypothetical protein